MTRWRFLQGLNRRKRPFASMHPSGKIALEALGNSHGWGFFTHRWYTVRPRRYMYATCYIPIKLALKHRPRGIPETVFQKYKGS